MTQDDLLPYLFNIVEIQIGSNKNSGELIPETEDDVSSLLFNGKNIKAEEIEDIWFIGQIKEYQANRKNGVLGNNRCIYRFSSVIDGLNDSELNPYEWILSVRCKLIIQEKGIVADDIHLLTKQLLLNEEIIKNNQCVFWTKEPSSVYVGKVESFSDESLIFDDGKSIKRDDICKITKLPEVGKSVKLICSETTIEGVILKYDSDHLCIINNLKQLQTIKYDCISEIYYIGIITANKSVVDYNFKIPKGLNTEYDKLTEATLVQYIVGIADNGFFTRVIQPMGVTPGSETAYGIITCGASPKDSTYSVRQVYDNHDKYYEGKKLEKKAVLFKQDVMENLDEKNIYIIKYTYNPSDSSEKVPQVRTYEIIQAVDFYKYTRVEVTEAGDITKIPFFQYYSTKYKGKKVLIEFIDKVRDPLEGKIIDIDDTGFTFENEVVPFSEIEQVNIYGKITIYKPNATGYIDGKWFFHLNSVKPDSRSNIITGSSVKYVLQNSRKDNGIDGAQIELLFLDLYFVSFEGNQFKYVYAEDYENGHQERIQSMASSFLQTQTFDLTNFHYHTICKMNNDNTDFESISIAEKISKPDTGYITAFRKSEEIVVVVKKDSYGKEHGIEYKLKTGQDVLLWGLRTETWDYSLTYSVDESNTLTIGSLDRTPLQKLFFGYISVYWYGQWGFIVQEDKYGKEHQNIEDFYFYKTSIKEIPTNIESINTKNNAYYVSFTVKKSTQTGKNDLAENITVIKEIANTTTSFNLFTTDEKKVTDINKEIDEAARNKDKESLEKIRKKIDCRFKESTLTEMQYYVLKHRVYQNLYPLGNKPEDLEQFIKCARYLISNSSDIPYKLFNLQQICSYLSKSGKQNDRKEAKKDIDEWLKLYNSLDEEGKEKQSYQFKIIQNLRKRCSGDSTQDEILSNEEVNEADINEANIIEEKVYLDSKTKEINDLSYLVLHDVIGEEDNNESRWEKIIAKANDTVDGYNTLSLWYAFNAAELASTEKQIFQYMRLLFGYGFLSDKEREEIENLDQLLEKLTTDQLAIVARTVSVACHFYPTTKLITDISEQCRNDKSVDILRPSLLNLNTTADKSSANELPIKNIVRLAVLPCRDFCNSFSGVFSNNSFSKMVEKYQEMERTYGVWMENENGRLPALFEKIREYVKKISFSDRSNDLLCILRYLKELKEEIVNNPTLISLYLIYPGLEKLKSKVESELTRLCQNTLPTMSFGTILMTKKEESKITLRIPICIESSNGQAARNIRLSIREKNNCIPFPEKVIRDEMSGDMTVNEDLTFDFKKKKSAITLCLEIKYDVYRGNFDSSYTSLIDTNMKFGPLYRSVTVVSKPAAEIDEIRKRLAIFTQNGMAAIPKYAKNCTEECLENILRNRDDDIKKIITELKDGEELSPSGKWVLLVGQWRVGKTTVLNRIQYELQDFYKEKIIVPNPFNFPSRANGGFEDSFAWSLYDHIRSYIVREDIKVSEDIARLFYDTSVKHEVCRINPDGYRNRRDIECNNIPISWDVFQSFLSDFIFELRKTKGTNIVLLLDEFNVMLPNIENEYCTPEFLQNWANIFIQNTSLLCVTAGSEAVDTMFARYASNQKEKASYIVLDYLNESDVGNLVDFVWMTKRETSILPRPCDGIKTKCYKLTGGSPFILKKLFDSMLDYFNDKDRKTQYMTDDRWDELFDWMFKNLSKDKAIVERQNIFKPLFDPIGDEYNRNDSTCQINLDILNTLVQYADVGTHQCKKDELEKEVKEKWIGQRGMEENTFEKYYNQLKDRGIITESVQGLVRIKIDFFFEYQSRLQKIS